MKLDLIDCPICGKPTKLEYVHGLYYYRFCSVGCNSPLCCHADPEHTALSWNDFARWARGKDRTDQLNAILEEMAAVDNMAAMSEEFFVPPEEA